MRNLLLFIFLILIGCPERKAPDTSTEVPLETGVCTAESIAKNPQGNCATTSTPEQIQSDMKNWSDLKSRKIKTH
jgi:hypothetical protein